MTHWNRLFGASALATLITACASTGQDDPPAQEIAAVEPPAPVYLADQVLGAAPADLDALFGAPALTRKEGQGEFRRYALETCSLIVILYPDESDEVRAAHIEATALTSGKDKPDLDACLAAG